MNRATPFVLTREAMTAKPELMLQRSNPTLGAVEDYERRDTLVLTADQATQSNEDIAEIVWSRFQNIDDDHLCPDGGRSLMMGDLVYVQVEGREPAWLIAMAMGFQDVTDLVAKRALLTGLLDRIS